MKVPFRRILLLLALLLFFSGLILLSVYLKDVATYQKAVKDTVFSGVEIADVPDGTYIGEYDVNFIYAKVEVTVRDGAITNINILEHKNERGKSAEIVTDRIIKEQKIDVDAVSGATNSSTVIKKAVENALQGET
ncbi:MAG: FMN-binding protein [Lachnospiraceae bacterium]|nr:FMN-binding protein [Lachnospiraceae bacterium]